MKMAEQRIEQMDRILEKTAWDATGYLNHVPRTTKFRRDAYYRVLAERQKIRAAQAANFGVAESVEKGCAK